MPNERTRNYIVGLTMLAAIAAFMVVVFELSNIAAFSHGRPYVVTVISNKAGGVTSGTSVNFNDVVIGTVSRVILSPAMDHVEITLSIQPDIQIPANAQVTVGKPAALGAAFVGFALPEEITPASAPAKISYLPTDGSARVTAEAIDSNLIPKRTTDTLTAAANDISILAKRLTATADGLNELLAKRPLAEYEAQDPTKRTANISILVQRLDKFVHNIDSLIGDQETIAAVHRIMKNLDDSSTQLTSLLAQAKTTLAAADGTLTKFGNSADQISSAATQASSTLRVTETQIVRTAEQLSGSLAALQTTLADINKGKGTAGRLVNDPRLYEGLVDLTNSLKSTSDDLNTLIQKWKEEGLPLHLK